MAASRNPNSSSWKPVSIYLQKQQNDLRIQRLSLVSQLKKLTGLRLIMLSSLTQQRPIMDGRILREKQQQANVAVAEKEVQRIRDQHYPTVKLVGALTENYGTAYNTDESIQSQLQLLRYQYFNPLFDQSLSTSIDLAQNQLHREKLHLAQLQIDLEAEADTLANNYQFSNSHKMLAVKSLCNTQENSRNCQGGLPQRTYHHRGIHSQRSRCPRQRGRSP